MSSKIKIEDEEIISFLLDELDDEKKLKIKQAIKENPNLLKKKRLFSETIDLLKESSNDPFSKIAEKDWELSENKKNKIFCDRIDKITIKESKNLMFWIPLGVAACILIIVLAQDLDQKNTLEIASTNSAEKIEKEKNQISKFNDLELKESSKLDQIHHKQTMEGANLELSTRNKTELFALNEEPVPKQPIPDLFNSNKNLHFQGEKKSDTQIKQEQWFAERPKAKIAKKTFADSKISQSQASDNQRTPTNLSKLSEDKLTTAEELKDSSSINNKNRPTLEVENKGSLKTENNSVKQSSYPKAAKKIKLTETTDKNTDSVNLNKLIDLTSSVFLFSPENKVLSKVKIENRENQDLELSRLSKSKEKIQWQKSDQYQLRLTFDHNSPIILVGSLKQKTGDDKQGIGNKNNQLHIYIFKIQESWILSENETRNPIELK